MFSGALRPSKKFPVSTIRHLCHMESPGACVPSSAKGSVWKQKQ
jgi:hypothetical protein